MTDRKANDALIGRIDSYLTAMLRLWAARGWDEARQGHQERLDAAHRPVDLGFRRLTVCARQLFVFSRAESCGLIGGARSIADRTFRYLVDRFRDPVHGGFTFTVDPDGAPLDRSKDLYGHAFALLGLAEYLAISDATDAGPLLAETDASAMRHFHLPQGWYAASAAADWSGRDAKLLQNPHMHLLEAYLAADRATGNALYRDHAADLIELMRTSLREPQSGMIIEFRNEVGEPDSERGHIVEPGHLFEWCWLLHQSGPQLGDATCLMDAAALFERGLAVGIDQEFGGVFDQVSIDGRLVADTKRIWPVTELVKACAARFNATRQARDLARLRDAVEFLFGAYLLPDGGWRERLRRDLACYDDTLPATTCYHLLLGLLEARAALTDGGRNAAR
jgi:mannose-6-phosphate isomerase